MNNLRINKNEIIFTRNCETVRITSCRENAIRFEGFFCEDVFEGFKKFGKVRGADQMNLNYFMIYFVFPTILSEEENGEDLTEDPDLVAALYGDVEQWKKEGV